LAALAVLATTPYALTGCGGTECGEGTTEQDGQCVAQTTGDSVTCADGTTLTDGKCEADVSNCGEGTTEQDGQCVADEGGNPADSCGEGTQYDEGAEACVPTSTIECGDGTTEQDGACVADPQDSTCQAGTRLADDGSCVVDMAACGDKTQLDPNSNTCLATDEVCGANTAYDADSDSCVPTDSVCDAGTVYSMDTGLCLPEATCKAGDVILNGNCVSPVEEAIANADFTSQEAMDPVANNDDVLNGGTANTLTIPAMGTVVAAGEIGTPVDLDGDMVLDQDVDAYTFSATAGQTLQVSVQPTAGPSLSFLVVEGGALNALGREEVFVRYSTLGFNSGSSRAVVLPRDGDYTIVVAPSSYISNGFEGGPTGDDNWKYALRVEEIAPFTATDVDITAGPITGDFQNLSDNYFRLTNFTGGPATLTVNSLGEDVGQGIFTAYDSNGIIAASGIMTEGEESQLVLPQGDVFVLIDWGFILGGNTGFDISLAPVPNDGDLGVITPGTPVTSTPADYAGDQERSYTFAASAGDVIEITHTNAEGESVEISVTDATGREVFSQSSFSVVGDASPGVGYVYVPQGGNFLVTLTNPSATDTFTASAVTLNAITPTDQGMFGVGDSLAATQANAFGTNYADFHRVSVTAGAVFTGTVSATNGTGDPDLVIANALDGSPVFTSAGGGDETIEGFNVLQPGDYIFVVRAADALSDGYSVAIDFGALPAMEIEPNDSTATATPLPPFPFDIIGTGGYRSADGSAEHENVPVDTPFDYFSFTLANDLLPNEILYLSIETIGDNDPSSYVQVGIYDDQGNVVSGPTTAEFIRLKELETQDLLAGTYYVGVSVSFDTSFDTQYLLHGELIPPPFSETEMNNTPATANMFPPVGELGLGTSTRDGMDPDIFSFTVATPGVYEVGLDTTGASGCAVLSLHNAAGDIIEQDAGSATLSVSGFLQATTYLFSVSGDAANCAGDTATFDYEAVISNPMPMADAVDIEPNNDAASAVMGMNTTANAILGTITSPTDEDWYMFNTAAQIDLLINKLDFGGLDAHQGMVFEFFDANGASLGVDTATVPAGNFFVKVSGFNSTDFIGNSYRFAVGLPPTEYLSAPMLGLAINSGSTTVTDTIMVTDTCTIADLRVYVDITHEYRGDLEVTLTSPLGTTETFLTSRFDGTDDYIGYAPTDFGDSPLNNFDGESTNGSWTITIEDTFPSFDDGTFNQWGIEVTCAP
jgi:subtilisin-like proprotein convertase family protein